MVKNMESIREYKRSSVLTSVFVTLEVVFGNNDPSDNGCHDRQRNRG